MSRLCEVRFRQPGDPISFRVDDSINPETAEGRAEIRRLAQEEIARRGTERLYPERDIDYDVFVDRDGNGVLAPGNAEKLGINGSTHELAWGATGSSPLVYHYTPPSGTRVRMAVEAPANETGTNGLNFDDVRPGLGSVSYLPTDTTADISNEAEARNFAANFESAFPDTDRGRQQRFAVYNRGSIRLVSGGTMSIRDLYSRYSIRAPNVQDYHPLEAAAAGSSGGSTGGTTDATSGMDVMPHFNETLAARRARFRDMEEGAQNSLDYLISAILGGNWDAVRQYAIMLAHKTGLEATEVAAIMTTVMEQLNIGDAASRDELARIVGGSQQQPSDRARMQVLQNQLASNDQFRNLVMSSLRDASARKEGAEQFAQAMLGANERTVQRPWGA